MKVGVSTACLYPQMVEDCLRQLGEMGIRRTEIFLNTHSELEEGFVRDMKRTADFYGMEVLSLHPYTSAMEPMMFFSPYQRRYTDVLEYYKRYFFAMNILEADCFVFHGNKAVIPCPMELYVERYSGLFQLGKEFGVTVAQENVARCTCRSLAFMKEMAEELGDGCAFVLDTKQAHRSGEDPIEIVRTLGSRICHIHFSDSGEQGDCLLYGAGSYDNGLLFQTLRDQAYSGSVVLELYRQNYDTPWRLAENYRLLSRDLNDGAPDSL